MPEQIRNILGRVLEWWNKFTSKQKTFIIAVSAGIIMTLVILLTLLNQTQYVVLLTATDPAAAAEVRDLLEADGTITWRVTPDGLRFEVDKKQQAEAIMLMGANNIQSSVWSIDNVTSGGFSTTEADKQKRYKVYLENQFASMAMSLANVKSARVSIDLPENDGTLLSQDKESTAWVQLELSGDFTEEQAASLAKGISVGLGAPTPANITITDTNGNTWFSGEEIYSGQGGSAGTQLSTKNKAENTINSEVRRVLMGTNEYDKVVVASSVAIDFTSTSSVDSKYYTSPDRDEGYLAREHHYDAETTQGTGDPPGTDSNTEGGSYQWPDYATSSSTESERSLDRLVSQLITEHQIPPGALIFNDSSVSVTTTRTNVVREEDVRRQGLLDGVTWDEYKDANNERTVLDVDEEMYYMVANASGFPVENVTFRSYSENIFLDAEGMALSWTDIVQIILIVIILGLLAFVVIRSMRGERAEAEAEELSVESLLQSQPELEDINIDEGTEAKKMIDKFVDDNPEAAAALLRNWLTEEWG